METVTVLDTAGLNDVDVLVTMTVTEIVVGRVVERVV